jgi:hypothetical protein
MIGASDTGDLMVLMRIFIVSFGSEKSACSSRDREHVVREWFRFLKRHRFEFRGRLRKNTLARNDSGKVFQASRPVAPIHVNRGR